jgi:hypothetical protein
VALLTIKAIAIGSGVETGVFSIEPADKHGFPVGDPRKSKREELKIFGMGDHFVEITCGTSKDSVKVSQAELNRILMTLHSVSGEPSETPTHK